MRPPAFPAPIAADDRNAATDPFGPLALEGRTGTALSARARTASGALKGDLADGARWNDFCLAVREVALQVIALARCDAKLEKVAEALHLIREMITADVQQRLEAEGPVLPTPSKGWAASVARMVIAPAWASPSPPPLEKVPDWLQEDFAEWMFAVPAVFAAPGQADRFAGYWETRLSELVTWVEANPGATMVKAALASYQRSAPTTALCNSHTDLRRWAEMHSRLMARLECKGKKDEAVANPPRQGGRLRVGFVLACFDDSPETQAAMPLMTGLDPRRFEVEVFVQNVNGSRWEQRLRSMVGQIQELPEEGGLQRKSLREARLDVLFFAANLAGDSGAVAKLATHRLAGLQVATAGQHTTTSGGTAIDLFVAGECGGLANSVAAFSERLGLYRGPIRSFDLSDLDRPAKQEWERTSLGLPQDSVVIFTSADWTCVTPEAQILWTDIVTQLPGSRLVIHLTGVRDNQLDRVQRLGAGLERLLAARGVSEDRIVVMPAGLTDPADIAALFAVGDLFIDNLPVSNDIAALCALKAGLPVLALAGAAWRARRVAGMLDWLGFGDMVHSEPEVFTASVIRIATDDAARSALAERVSATMAAPLALDPLGVGIELGDLLQIACHEVASDGLVAFRARRAPLRAPTPTGTATDYVASAAAALAASDYDTAAADAQCALRIEPASGAARALLGRALLELDHPASAVDWLLTSTEAPDADAARWFNLARALRRNEQSAEAVKALEISLKLDPSRPDSWALLVDIAQASGAHEMAADGLQVLRGLAPNHPGIRELEARQAG